MSPSKPESTRELVARLRGELDALVGAGSAEAITGPARKRITADVIEIKSRLDDLLRQIDPIKQPDSVFDPAEPNLVGRFVALALVAQPRKPLAEFERFYGSGVYALYYNGDFEPYATISRKETPIYVGKADPADGTAKTPTEQGDKLSVRMLDHRRNIAKADNIKVEDFECRALVVQSGWQQAAESYLIRLFRPIWNNEVQILYGLGKHGDAATTRANKRSPWDTLHPGRGWAGHASLVDARSTTEIIATLEKHFAETKVYEHLEDVLDDFIIGLRQAS